MPLMIRIHYVLMFHLRMVTEEFDEHDYGQFKDNDVIETHLDSDLEYWP